MLGVPAVAASAIAIPAVASAAGAWSADQVDRSLLELRVVLATAALLLFGAGWLRRRRGVSEARGSARRVMLGLVAGAAIAANFNLFVWTGLHRHEFYHYYLGSKFFPELGYFGLYVCSVQAVQDGGGALPPDLAELTDLRSKERMPASQVLASAPRCRDQFEPARWDAFRSDVARFRAWMGDGVWVGVLRDHGYNPSPAWTLFGRPLASVVPPSPEGLWLLARIDLLLLLATFGALAWVFGFEAACLAAIAWGSCGHTRYQWTGDAFLRQLWLAAVLGGIALLAKGRAAAAGALLAIATLERVFPGAFLLGIGLREVCHWLRARRVTPEFVRFVAGAGVAAVLVVAAATAVAGRGVAVWREFAENTRGMLSFTPRNALGLEYALSFTRVPPPEGLGETPTERQSIVQDYRRRTLASRRVWQVGALALFGSLLAVAAWRGAGRGPDGAPRLRAWEAAAMGCAIVPFATMPGSYYVGFVLAGAPLAIRWPRIGFALLLACLGWSITLVAFGSRAIAFASSSWILLAYALWLLAELAFAQPRPAPDPLSRR